MPVSVVSMGIGDKVVVREVETDRSLGILMMNRRARHADRRGDRMEREHGHQYPNQKCLEHAVHR